MELVWMREIQHKFLLLCACVQIKIKINHNALFLVWELFVTKCLLFEYEREESVRYWDSLFLVWQEFCFKVGMMSHLSRSINYCERDSKNTGKFSSRFILSYGPITFHERWQRTNWRSWWYFRFVFTISGYFISRDLRSWFGLYLFVLCSVSFDILLSCCNKVLVI